MLPVQQRFLLWLQQLFQTERNHFDRFGHLMQGFVPAILFRELYAGCSPVQSQAWLNYFAFFICLAFAAVFELIEWFATTLAGEDGDAFLWHQGDVWNAQWDMLWAMIGAILSLLLLTALHQRQLSRPGEDVTVQMDALGLVASLSQGV